MPPTWRRQRPSQVGLSAGSAGMTNTSTRIFMQCIVIPYNEVYVCHQQMQLLSRKNANFIPLCSAFLSFIVFTFASSLCPHIIHFCLNLFFPFLFVLSFISFHFILSFIPFLSYFTVFIFRLLRTLTSMKSYHVFFFLNILFFIPYFLDIQSHNIFHYSFIYSYRRVFVLLRCSLPTSRFGNMSTFFLFPSYIYTYPFTPSLSSCTSFCLFVASREVTLALALLHRILTVILWDVDSCLVSASVPWCYIEVQNGLFFVRE